MKRSHAPTSRLIAATLAAVTAIGLGACGGDDRSGLLTRSRASELRSTLSSVEQRAENGDCVGAEAQARVFEEQVGSLPPRVDAEVRNALADGASRLQTLVVDRCGATGPTGPTATPAPAPPEEGTTDEKDKGKKKPKPEKPNEGKGNGNGNGDGDLGDEGDGSGGIEITPPDQTDPGTTDGVVP